MLAIVLIKFAGARLRFFGIGGLNDIHDVKTL